jgi:site-specific recombinase XerD
MHSSELIKGKNMNSIETARSYHELIRQLEKLRKRFRQKNIKETERDFHAMQRFVRYLANAWQLQTLSLFSLEHFEGYREHLHKNNKPAALINADLKAIKLFREGILELRHRPLAFTMLDLSRGNFVKREMTWSNKEFQAMCGFAKRAGRADFVFVINLAYYAGFRIDEFCRLTHAEAEKALRTGLLTIQDKHNKTRTTPVDKRIREILENLSILKDIPAHVFIRQIHNFIRRHRNKLPPRHFTQKQLTFDGLRHSFAFNKHYIF